MEGGTVPSDVVYLKFLFPSWEAAKHGAYTSENTLPNFGEFASHALRGE